MSSRAQNKNWHTWIQLTKQLLIVKAVYSLSTNYVFANNCIDFYVHV